MSIDIPVIDFNGIGGSVGFTGSFAGISPFRQQTQFESLNTTSLITSTQDDIFNLFANINGSIETYCKLNDNLYILAGNFTFINTTTYNYIAQLNTQTRQFSPLQQGLDGPVHTVYCSNTTSVYVGGDFTAPINSNASQYTGHVALYSNNQWYPTPWKGFNGPVYTIVPDYNQQSIYFAGQFNSTGNGQYYNQNITYPLIDLSSTASISSGNGLESGNYSTPSSVLCSQSPWLLQNNLPGYWEAIFNYPVQPSIFRLSNTHIEGKNTNQFNIISLVSNEYFTLSYTDPITNQIVTCSDSCYLSNDSTIPYQDFTVLNIISTSGIRININSWYGSAGGLGGVAIYKQDSTLQPEIASMSNSTCAANSVSTTTSSTVLTGNWTSLYSYEAYQNYIVSEVSTSQLTTADVSVTYLPYIAADGIYNVYIDTPGCVGTSSCEQRTQMELSINLTPGNTTTYTLNQNIISDQRALIYTGLISATTDAFKPSILMKISPTAQASSTSSILVFGSAIEFSRNSTGSTLSSILQYFPGNQTWTALAQQLGNAVVRTLQSDASGLYIGGQFNVNNTIANIARYNTTHLLRPLTNNGLNGQVSTSLLIGTNLILGGSFNNTLINGHTGLNHIAIYDTLSNTWSSMHEGVNNNVDYIYSKDQTTVHLSGPFNSTMDNTRLYNNAQWNLNDKSWTYPTYFIAGPVANEIPLSNAETLYLGNIVNAQTYRASNLVSLDGSSTTSPLSQIDPSATIDASAYWKNDTGTHLILAGVFQLNGSTFNVIMYSENQWRGVLQNITGTISRMIVVENTLYMGGNFTSVYPDGSPMTSFAMYRLDTGALQQVAGVVSEASKPGVVNAIYPYNGGVYVGGAFSYAGSLSCSAICMLSMETVQWNQVSDNVSGNVTDMAIDSQGQVTVVGTLQVGSTSTVLATIGTGMAARAAPASQQQISSATSILYVNDHQYLVTGQGGIATWDGTSFTADTVQLYVANQAAQTSNMMLHPASQVEQIALVPVTSSSSPRYPPNSNTMLMAVGHIVSDTNSSVALFDGEQWHPYLLSTDGQGYGHINRVFTSAGWSSTTSRTHRYLSLAAVVLISLAISLGIIFILMLIAFIYLYFKHKNAPVQYYNDPMNEWKPKHRPTSLLAMLNAANLTEPEAPAASGSQQQPEERGYTTALDPGTAATHRGGQSVDMGEGRLRDSSGLSMSGMTFAALLANAMKSTSGPASDDAPKLYYAKYPFEAKEFGELAFDAQTPIVVTDTSDNVWWMGYKDDGKGNAVSGLFPSNYVQRDKR